MNPRYPRNPKQSTKAVLLAGLALCSGLLVPLGATAKDTRATAAKNTPASLVEKQITATKYRPALNLLAGQNFKAAIANLTALIDKDPGDSTAYCLRGYTYDLINNMSAALKDLNKAIELNPKLVVSYCRRAAHFIETNQLEEALADANKAVTLDPKMAEPYWLRSFVYFRQDKFEQAIADSSKAISIFPNAFSYYLNRAQAYRELKNYDLALADVNKAIKLQPRSIRAFNERGYLNKVTGRANAAVIDYTQAITLASNGPQSERNKIILSEAYVLRAEAYAALKQNNKSIADLSAAIKITPKDLSLIKQRAHAYYNTNQNQKALEDYTYFIQKSPPRADYLTWRAHTYDRLGQYYDQLNDYTEAIDLYPYLADLWQSRAYALYKVGLLDLALADCKVSDTLEPKNTRQSYTASYVFEDRGEFDKALECRAKILESEKNLAFAWSANARLNQALGNLKQASSERMKAHELGTPIERAELLCCHALFDYKNPAPQHPEQDISNHLKAEPVVLPFHYDAGLHICVPAKVNGHNVELMLDTGCGHSDLWADKLKDIAKLEETKLTGRMANGDEFKYGYVKVKEMNLGTLPLKDVTLSIQKGLPAHKYLSGFLGGNILEHTAVTIDYLAKTVTLSATATTARSERAIVVPLMVRNHQPLTMISVDDQIERMALFDTGSPQGMAPYALIKPVIKSPITFDETINGPWLGELKSKEVRFKSIGLGDSKFSDVIFDVFKEDGAANAAHEITIGNDFLSCFKTVTFDYPARQLILEPRESDYRSGIMLYFEGRNELKTDHYQKAIELFNKSLPLEPEVAEDVFYYRAKAYFLLKQYQKALDDLTACIKIEPKAPWSYYQRARVHDEMKNYQKEIDDLTTSINLDPEYKFAYRNRAEAYEKIGRKDLAKRDRKLAGKE